jgi:DNA-binding HxlR family transcriptional regulator
VLNRDYETQPHCGVARALEVIGERWSLLIVRDAFLGRRRFEEFQESLGIARNTLTDRLNRLVDEGIFDRVLYNDRPERYEYRLTTKGGELLVALTALREWGEKYGDAKKRTLRRRSDKRPVVAALVPKGTRGLRLDDVELKR